ncbi:hypothetical protein M433DRAFT_8022 [Acidomyces richmondensis BFW]|nr:hypothetical protein M433DRAFT_8022 [Acidomyces richmondensis BFW]
MNSNTDEITSTLPHNHEIEGHSNVSRPPLPPQLHRLSELVDPAMLPDGSHVRSLSGTIYTPEAFCTHPNRPRSIRERQENIREKVKQARAASRLALEVEDGRKCSRNATKDKIKVNQPSTGNSKSESTSKGTMTLIEGPGKEVGELPPIECTKADCHQRFHTVKDMKRHKVNDPDHFYCKKCNVDCKDWVALTQHKVSVMAPWLDPRAKHPDDERGPLHITCEFCGMDFQSFGGRRSHRERSHKADQTIQCPAHDQGCNLIFTRAALLVRHLETGECAFISADFFKECVMHKHIRKEILRTHMEIVGNLNRSLASGTGHGTPGLILDESDEDEDGGVSLCDSNLTLLDHQDEAQNGGYQPLKPEVENVMDLQSLEIKRTKQWPLFSDVTRLRDLTEKAALDYSNDEDKTSYSECGNSVPSGSGGEKLHTELWPPLRLASPTTLSTADEDDDEHDDNESHVTTKASPIEQSAWTGTSRVLFDDGGSTPAGDWNAIAERHEEAVLGKNRETNLMYSEWYYPHSEQYDSGKFYDAFLGSYLCPFIECDATFESSQDIAEHFMSVHLQTRIICSSCYKRFDRNYKLVAHMEDTEHCRIKQSGDFNTLLDEVSGGFLTADIVAFPRVIKAKNEVTKFGRPTDGIMKVEYRSIPANESRLTLGNELSSFQTIMSMK